MQNTRERIIEHLSETHGATVQEISRAFDMTSANIRYHLGLMMEKGHVEAVRKIGSHRRGRPQFEYRLTTQVQQNSLLELASASIRTIESLKQPRQREKLMRALAQQIAHHEESETSWSPKQLRDAITRLNELKYRAHWEARAEGPQVIFGQCPYAQIIQDHPLLCQMDAYLLDTLLGIEVEQLTKISNRLGGAVVCTFAARMRSDPNA